MLNINSFIIFILPIISLVGLTKVEEPQGKISVLNLGVFHMGETPDAYTTDYDESQEKSKQEIRELVEQLAKYKPTIILIENNVKNNDLIASEYEKYVADPTYKTKWTGSEDEILGFEIGRICGTQKIYGIDHYMEYNYQLNDIAEEAGADKYLRVQESIFASPYVQLKPKLLKDKLLLINSQEYRDFSIMGNAEHLALANSEEGFEGADEAAKYYQRNLRMYANINKVDATAEDRILIISGGAHAAFFDMFMKRSTIYDVEDVRDYIK